MRLYTGLATRGLNMAMRGGTLVSKFLLIFVLAKLLSPAEVGLYGLMTVTTSYVLLALGLDFYTFSTRELLASDRSVWAAKLRDQCVFYLLAYLVVLPPCLLLFGLQLLPWYMAMWFFPLLALEHIAQELNRLLVATSEPLWASLVMFIRSGVWAIFVAGWMWWQPDDRNLNLVFGAWLVSVFVACGLAMSRFRHLDARSLQRKIDWDWMRRGLKVALPFTIATLSLRALHAVDRYLIEGFDGVEVLAAYVLFVGIANAIMSFLDAAVFSFQYPKLLNAASQRDESRFQREMAKLWKQTLMLTAALSLGAMVLAKPVVLWLDKPVYVEHFSLLYWAVMGMAFLAVSNVPHYGLYAKHHDRPIVIVHIASIPVFGLAIWLFRPVLATATVPAAVAVACLFILLAKLVMYRRATT